MQKMREIIEFRMLDKYAKRVLGPSDGVRLGFDGWVRKIQLPMSDPRVSKIAEARVRAEDTPQPIFSSWNLYRRYSKQELANAHCLLLQIKHSFEPVGEQCGTIYDDSAACKFCGVGWRQTSDLFLDARKLPKRGNLAFVQTIVPEVIVSARFVELFEKHSLKGAEFRAIRDKRKPDLPLDWYQPLIHATPVKIRPETRTGNDPFDDDPKNEYRCPRGHVIGLNVLSELYVSQSDFNPWDFAFTRQFVGTRGGVIRPHQLLLISPRLFRLLSEHQLKGFDVEVAHLEE